MEDLAKDLKAGIRLKVAGLGLGQAPTLQQKRKAQMLG